MARLDSEGILPRGVCNLSQVRALRLKRKEKINVKEQDKEKYGSFIPAYDSDVYDSHSLTELSILATNENKLPLRSLTTILKLGK